MPRVSVILPVHNGAAHLKQSIDSILAQTYSDLELIILDDASTDASPDLLSRLSDPRVSVRRNERNLGLPTTLNLGIGAASGTYVARQDQDDFSHPDRLKQQVDLLDSRPDIGLLGTWATILGCTTDDRWVPVGVHKHPEHDALLRWRLCWNNPFVHSSVMLRRSVIDALGGYATAPDRLIPEDYELWSQMSQVTGIANIARTLQCYRQSPSGMSETLKAPIQEGVVRIGSENMARALGPQGAREDATVIVSILNGAPTPRPTRRDALRLARRLGTVPRSIADWDRADYAREVWPTQARFMVKALRNAP